MLASGHHLHRSLGASIIYYYGSLLQGSINLHLRTGSIHGSTRLMQSRMLQCLSFIESRADNCRSHDQLYIAVSARILSGGHHPQVSKITTPSMSQISSIATYFTACWAPHISVTHPNNIPVPSLCCYMIYHISDSFVPPYRILTAGFFPLLQCGTPPLSLLRSTLS